MDEWIAELTQLTEDCAHQLERMEYADMERFVEQRERFVEKLRAADPAEADKAEYKRAVDHILRYDALILARMHALKAEAEASLHRTKTAQRQKSAYDAGYTPDSYYFDRKK
jgi:antirestriction protein ArdC